MHGNIKSTSKIATFGIPAFSIAITFLLVFAVGLVGIARDLQTIRRTHYATEISKAQSHAERTVGRIETELMEGRPLDAFRLNSSPKWLENHWRKTIPGKPDRLYAAIVDSQGQVLAHSDELDHERKVSPYLEANWDRSPILEFGSRIYRIHNSVLSQETPAIDISTSITFQGNEVASYHTGLDASWLENNIWDSQQESIRVWGGILATIGSIVIASSVLLYKLGVHTHNLERALEKSETKRLADVSNLILGLAHELRNPLNAVRLNLFTTEKLFCGGSHLPTHDAIDMIHESVREVERVDELIGQLLGFTQVDSKSPGWCWLDQEIRSILTFLRQSHEQKGIHVDYVGPSHPISIKIDDKPFRQILHNILKNAREASEHGGTIAVRIMECNSSVRIDIEDSGPGIPFDHYEKIFEPFYSTRDGGTGLGLAVVTSIIKRHSGSIVCSRSKSLGGMCFSIQLPILRSELN